MILCSVAQSHHVGGEYFDGSIGNYGFTENHIYRGTHSTAREEIDEKVVADIYREA